MDVSPSNNPQTKLNVARTEAASKLLDLAKLSVGSKLVAQVEGVTKVDAALRQTLMNYASKQATETGNSPNSDRQLPSPALSKASSAQLQQLLNKPSVFAVQLNALGRRILTFTATQLEVKQKIAVVVRADGQLQVDEKAKIGSLPNTRSEQSPANANTDAQQNYRQKSAVLSEGLRRYLPLQQKLSDVFSQLKKVSDQAALSTKDLTQIRKSTSDQNAVGPVDRAISSRLQKFLALAPSLEKVGQPAQLKQLVQNSGAFLEAKLSQKSVTSTLANLKSNSSGAVGAQHASSEHGQSRSGQLPLTNAASSEAADIKAELLRLIKDVSSITTQASTPSGRPSAKTSNNVDTLLRSLLTGTSTPTALQQAARPNSAQANAVAPILLAALARISGLQIRHLTQNIAEFSAQPQGGFLELPVRINEQFYPLVLQIQEKTYDEATSRDKRDKDKKRESKKTKHWQVFMEFDLDEFGSFASDIRVSEKRVKTQLWVQQQQLWISTNSHLDELRQSLEENGIVVEELHCQHGRPPEKKIGLQQSLVDIRT